MFENIINFFKRKGKNEMEDIKTKETKSKNTAKERLHLVLMQDRANMSADFLDMMKQEIIDVIKKYIDVDENAIDVKLENKTEPDGTIGAPALYANIPIISIKNEARKIEKLKEEEKPKENEEEKEEKIEEIEKEETEKEPEEDIQEKEENKEVKKEEEKQDNNT